MVNMKGKKERQESREKSSCPERNPKGEKGKPTCEQKKKRRERDSKKRGI